MTYKEKLDAYLKEEEEKKKAKEALRSEIREIVNSSLKPVADSIKEIHEDIHECIVLLDAKKMLYELKDIIEKADK